MTKGWAKAVVKPRIAATAHRTQLVDAKNAEPGQGLFEELLAGPGVMVQQFMDDILSEGERSPIFFAGQFSHAVLQTPRQGEFRVRLECAFQVVQVAGNPLYAPRFADAIDAALQPGM